MKRATGKFLEKSARSIAAGETLLSGGHLEAAANRAYYAMFYAVLALLATRKRETSKHSGAISLFDREFVKAGTFDKDFSRWLHEAFDLRQRADYAIEFQVTTKEAEMTLEHAVSFVGEVRTVLDKLVDNPHISPL